MYRYLLFHCYQYYPSGGMRDCEFKTNNFDELVPFINEHYNDTLMDHIHCYDIVEDKCYEAIMQYYEDENYFGRQKFLYWEEWRIGPKETIDSAIEEIKLLDTLVNVDRYSDSVYNSFRKEVCVGCSDPNCLRSKCEIYDCHKFENYFEI